MALPSSGPLSLADIQTEFGGSNPASLSEYYAGGAYVPAGTTGTNGAVPSSGTISIYYFYGTSSGPTYWIIYSSTGNGGRNASWNAAVSSGVLYILGPCDIYGSTSGFYNWSVIKTSPTPSSISSTTLYGSSMPGAGIAIISSNPHIGYCANLTLGSYSQDTFGLVKFDSSGAQQWVRAISNTNFATSGATGQYLGVVEDGIGGIYVAGIVPGGQLAMARYQSSNGTLSWLKNINYTSASWLTYPGFASNALSANNYDGTLMLTSTAYNSSSGRWVPTLISITTGGTVSGTRFGENNNTTYATISNAVADSSGNRYVVCSMSGSSNATVYFDAVLMKISTAGTKSYTSLLHTGTGNMNCHAIAIDSSNNIYVAANSDEYTNTGFGMVAKYNSSLTLQWQRKFTSTSGYVIYLTGIIVDSSSTFIAMGYRANSSYSTTSFNMRLPTDGSKTGTYGDYTYSVSTVSTSTPTFASISAPTAQASNFGSNIQSFTPTLTPDTTATLTSTITPI